MALSGGQQQRLCIARALAITPEILLMDEPASALDPIATQRIEELIYQLKARYTIVIVTHNMQQAARVSDRTAFFWLGRLVEYGADGSNLHQPGTEADRGLRHGAIWIKTSRARGSRIASGWAERRVEGIAMTMHTDPSLPGGAPAAQDPPARNGRPGRRTRALGGPGAGRAERPGGRPRPRRRRPINQLHIEIDSRCFKLLALHQPMAVDLRAIVSAVKINTDLERVGDLAINIAEAVKRYMRHSPVKELIDIPRMADIAQRMLRDALDAYVRRDVALAQAVLDEDDALDALKTQVFRELLTYMLQDPSTIEPSLDLILISRHLERIGDHATNVAEDVIFMVSARDVRHHAARGDPKAEDLRASAYGRRSARAGLQRVDAGPSALHDSIVRFGTPRAPLRVLPAGARGRALAAILQRALQDGGPGALALRGLPRAGRRRPIRPSSAETRT